MRNGLNLHQPGKARHQRRPRKRSNLAAMNWRRGVLLAGINLAVAVPLIVIVEMQRETEMKARYVPPVQHVGGLTPMIASPDGEQQTIMFDPCAMTFHYPPEQRVPRLVNVPAAVLSGWQQECPAGWSLAGQLKVGYSWVEPPSMAPARRTVDWGFAFLIAIQWMLVGGFPLSQPKRWWREPGAFITICAALGFGLVLIPALREFALLPATFAALAWLWWLGLLVWKCARFGWRLVARRSAAAS